MKTILVLLFAIFITNLVYGKFAFGYEPDSDLALKKTQELLRTKNLRDNAIKDSPEASNAHQRLKSLFGTSENQEQAYEMAAIMMEKIMTEAGGDPLKAQEILNKGLSNPASLAERMPSEFKEKLKNSANEVERSQSPTKR